MWPFQLLKKKQLSPRFSFLFSVRSSPGKKVGKSLKMHSGRRRTSELNNLSFSFHWLAVSRCPSAICYCLYCSCFIEKIHWFRSLFVHQLHPLTSMSAFRESGLTLLSCCWWWWRSVIIVPCRGPAPSRLSDFTSTAKRSSLFCLFSYMNCLIIIIFFRVYVCPVPYLSHALLLVGANTRPTFQTAPSIPRQGCVLLKYPTDYQYCYIQVMTSFLIQEASNWLT